MRRSAAKQTAIPHAWQRQSIPLYTARMTAAEQAAIRQVRQLFDKHDKYVNRNRHDFMFFSMMRSQAPVALMHKRRPIQSPRPFRTRPIVSADAWTLGINASVVSATCRASLPSLFVSTSVVAHRQMRISHRRIVASLWNDSGLLEPARQEIRCIARNASP